MRRALFLLRSSGDELLAGVLSGTFNDHRISVGQHYLIIERIPQVAVVYQYALDT